MCAREESLYVLFGVQPFLHAGSSLLVSAGDVVLENLGFHPPLAAATYLNSW